MTCCKQQNFSLKVQRLDPRALLPSCAHPGEDAGYDLCALESVTLRTGEPARIRTGLAIELPPGYAGLIRDRSSLAAAGLMVSGGVIDAGYRGEILVLLTPTRWREEGLGNWNRGQVEIAAGARIAQLIPIPVSTAWPIVEVQGLAATTRGAGGFGSTGV